MRRFGRPLLAFALGVGLAIPAANNAAAADNKRAAAVGGFIAGAAIGAAISGSTHSPQIIVNDYGPSRPGGGGWASAYRPGSGNVVCYPRQQACYHPSGAYAPNVTWREFGGRR